MRLEILEHGHGWKRRATLRAKRLIGRPELNPVTKTVLYRPELFGRQWLRLTRSVMQGPSNWSAGERELLGTFVSRQNTCRFCVGFHEAAAAELLGSTVTAERLEHWRRAGFDPQIVATMELLEKATLTPNDVDRGDVEAVRVAGVSDAAIRDALYVCFVFNAVNRIVNALDDS